MGKHPLLDFSYLGRIASLPLAGSGLRSRTKQLEEDGGYREKQVVLLIGEAEGTVPGGSITKRSVDELQALLEEAASDDVDWRERLLASLACRAAIRRNRLLAEVEMQGLVRELAGTAAPAACPHGSPLILQLSGSFLKRQFGW